MRLRRAAFVTACAGVVACGFDGVGLFTGEPGGGAPPGGPAPGSDGAAGDDAAAPDEGGTVVIDGASVVPELSLQLVSPPAQLDLEVEGTLGWTHWGRTTDDESSLNEKATAAGAIPTFVLTGSTDLRTYEDNFTLFRWTNGTPAATEPGTPNGVYSKTGHPKFTLSRQADVAPRRLVVYAGVYKCKGRFVATLGTGAGAKSATAEIDNADKGYGRFIVDHRAVDPSTPLVISWELITAYDPNNSNVTLAAATLMPRP